MGIFLDAQLLLSWHNDIIALVVPAHAQLAKRDPGHAMLARPGADNANWAGGYGRQPNERRNFHEIGADRVLAAAEFGDTGDTEHVGADALDPRAKRGEEVA